MMSFTHRPRLRGIVAAATLTLAGAAVLGTPALAQTPATPAAQTSPGPSAAAQPSAVAAGFGLSNQHSSQQTLINSANVAQLKLAWTVSTKGPVSGTPLIANGHAYFADWSGTVTAADAATGKILWQKQVEQPNLQWPWWGFLGSGALDNNVLIEASVEGMAFGLDPATGNVIWQTKFTDQPTSGDNASLLAANGVVYIGLASVDEFLAKISGYQPMARGGVVALDTQTGTRLWQTLLASPPQNGAAIWSSFALDPTTNLLYFDTGNNYTAPASPLSDSVIAANALTGGIFWSQQATSNDVFTLAQPIGPDYDFGGGPQLFDATINGQLRHLVGAGQKSGAYRVYDRITGQPVWATGVGPGGANGGIRGEASIGTDRLIVWSNDGKFGGTPAQHPITIAALDLATGKPLWMVPNAQPAIGQEGGFLSNDVYLIGSLDGTIKAYGAADGKVLMMLQAPGPIAASLIVQGDTLFTGTGVPATFGGKQGGSGVSAYTVSTTGAPHIAAAGGPLGYVGMAH